MIKYKNFFGEWVEVTREQAKEIAEHILRHASALKNEEAVEYIEKNKIKGIKVKDLLDKKEN